MVESEEEMSATIPSPCPLRARMQFRTRGWHLETERDHLAVFNLCDIPVISIRTQQPRQKKNTPTNVES
jgi:hypothetical protein